MALATGVISVSATAITGLAAKAGRMGVFFQNVGASKVWIGYGTDPTASQATYIPPGSGDTPGALDVNAQSLVCQAVRLTCSTGESSTVYYQEY